MRHRHLNFNGTGMFPLAVVERLTEETGTAKPVITPCTVRKPLLDRKLYAMTLDAPGRNTHLDLLGMTRHRNSDRRRGAEHSQ